VGGVVVVVSLYNDAAHAGEGSGEGGGGVCVRKRSGVAASEGSLCSERDL
jgi:hypothetical protein